MLFVLSDKKIKEKIVYSDWACVTFKFKQEHEFLPNPINTFLQIPFCVPKIKIEVINYEKTIDFLPSILQLMRFVIYLRFVRKEYAPNKKRI